MNTFDEAYFDAGINRIGTNCAKWDEMRRETGDPDMIPMWVADMDFPSPPTVQLALPGELFRALSMLNHAGALIFAAFMIGLFTLYPKNLGLRWLFPLSACGPAGALGRCGAGDLGLYASMR